MKFLPFIPCLVSSTDFSFKFGAACLSTGFLSKIIYMKKILFALLMVASIFVTAQKKTDPTTFAKTITPDALRKHLYIVASKEMEGRETATPGQKKAAAYIENEFKSLGLIPGNNSSYQLPYGVYQDSLTQTSIEVNGKMFELDKDFALNVGQT